MRPTAVTAAALRAMPLPDPDGAADKDGRGRVLVVAGGAKVPGAAVLTGLAALRAGAGKLQLAATAACAAGLGLAVPEAGVFRLPVSRSGEISRTAGAVLRPLLEHCDAVVLGPGMMDKAAACALAGKLLAAGGKARFVIDALALGGLADAGRRPQARAADLVITPHAGEMAALMGIGEAAVAADPIGVARAAAARFGAVTALKGATTWIVTPAGRVWRHLGGVVGLATSGSGDVLAGLVGGLLARGAPPAVAAVWGVWVHGAAGRALCRRVGPVGFLAREIVDEIPAILATLAAPARRGFRAREP